MRNYCVRADIADTSKERARGLMYKKELSPQTGMLFIFQKEGIYPFWMKNTRIPLDIIWADRSRYVVYISEDTPPCEEVFCPSINPAQAAQYVLEVNAGTVKTTGLQIGDRLEFEIE